MFIIRPVTALSAAAALLLLLPTLPVAGAFAPPAKPSKVNKPAKPVKKPAPPLANGGEETKGTQQMKGGDGVFGVVYTVVNNNGHGVNVQFIKARYTLEPHNDYNGTMPMPDQKLFVLTFAVKNPNKDLDVDGGIAITLVDENENNYEMGSGIVSTTANGNKEVSLSLKPGQGIGQDPTTNELSLAMNIPGSAKIKKIMLKMGRANVPDEKVLRFPIAGTTGGSPKNVIAPLPKYAADPTDPTGAVMLETSPVIMGKFYPDGYFAIRLNSVVLSPDAVLKGQKPDEGKVWAVATFTAKNIYSKEASLFDLSGEGVLIKDMDNEKYPAAEGWKRKATRDEEAGSDHVDKGEEETFRHFFMVPKDVKLKSLVYPSGTYGHNYVWDLTTPTAP